MALIITHSNTANTNAAASVSWIEHQTLEHIKGALTGDDRLAGARCEPRPQEVERPASRSSRSVVTWNASWRSKRPTATCRSSPTRSLTLEDQIQRLSHDHDGFRRRAQALVPRLDEVANWDEEEFEAVCDDIRGLLADVDRHDQAEVRLLQETLSFDEGGEG